MASVGLSERGERTTGDDRFDLFLHAAELDLRENRSSFEGELTRDLKPVRSKVVLRANADRYRARNAMGAQQRYVKRRAAAPAETLLRPSSDCAGIASDRTERLQARA